MAHKLDLNLLRIFSTAYECQSVTRTAEHLDVTQSAISNALNRLKSHVGQELFIRTGRGIKPTRFSDDLYQSIRAPLLEIESQIEGIGRFDPKESERQFVIYCHEAILHTLRKKLDSALKDYSISITLIELPSNEQQIYDDLADENADLVIDASAPEGHLFHSEIFAKQHLTCITRRNHPRLTPQTINQSTYLAESHAVYDLTRLNLRFVDWITEEILPPRTVYSQHKSLLGMIAAVSYSDAVGVVPQSVAVQYQEAFDLQLLDFPFKTKMFNSYMISLLKMQKNQANQWLRELVVRLN